MRFNVKLNVNKLVSYIHAWELDKKSATWKLVRMKLTNILDYTVLLLVLTVSCAVMSDNRCHFSSTVDDEDCDTPPVGVTKMPVDVAASSALALVPYNDQILPVAELYRAERRLTFSELTVTISQNWREVGVAAVVWDAAVVLCEYLVEHRALVHNKAVLELGAGTGLVGILASMLGAHVTLTDRPVALPVLRHNVAINNVKNTQVRQLVWAQKNLDTEFPRPYDVILGADIVYIEETFDDLLSTLDQLSDEKTVVMLSCTIRYERDVKFLDMLRKLFHVELVHSNRSVQLFTATKL